MLPTTTQKFVILICILCSPISVSSDESLSFDHGWALVYEHRFDDAREKFNEAKEQGDVRGIFGLGVLHYFGYGSTQKNPNKAVSLYLIASENGYLPAMHNLGYAYQHGIGVRKDIKTAIDWYEKAAQGGLTTSQFDLAYFHFNGIGVQRNYSKAFALYSAAKFRDPKSMHLVGEMLFEGQGVKIDKTNACAHVRAASLMGYEYEKTKVYCNAYILDDDQLSTANKIASELFSNVKPFHEHANMDVGLSK